MPDKEDELMELTFIREGHGWKQEAGETFKMLNTDPNEWHPCKILDVNYETGEIFWEMPVGYVHVDPKGFKDGHCHLCGHGIKVACFLQNDKTKMVLMVGSSCIGTYAGAKYVHETIKVILERKEKETFDRTVKRMEDKIVELKKSQWRFTSAYGRPAPLPYWLWLWSVRRPDRKADTRRKMKNHVKKFSALFEKEFGEVI